MRIAQETKEETDQRIKRYLFENGVAAVNRPMIEYLKVARMTAYKWYNSTEGMIAAGLAAANRDLTREITSYTADLAATQAEAVSTDTGGSAASPAQLRPSAKIFQRYCELLDDPICCGNVVFRALIEFHDRNSRLHEEAEICVQGQILWFREVLLKDAIDGPLQRARLLVSTAVGMSALNAVLPANDRAEWSLLLYRSIFDAKLP